jgi:hypothetical protein
MPEDGYGMSATEFHKPGRFGRVMVNSVYQFLAKLRVAVIINELHLIP